MILVKGWGSREERRRNNQISTNQNDVFLYQFRQQKKAHREKFFFVMQHYNGKKESITMSKKRARTISFISERFSNSVPQKSRSRISCWQFDLVFSASYLVCVLHFVTFCLFLVILCLNLVNSFLFNHKLYYWCLCLVTSVVYC